MTKQLKLIILMCVIILLVASIIFVGLKYVDAKKRHFVAQYISYKYVDVFFYWVEYYENDWIKSLAVLLSESEGNRLATSHKNCRGFYQIAPLTEPYCRRRLQTTITNFNPYAAEYNIASGNLLIKCWLKRAEGNYEEMLHIYNCGPGDYDNGKRNYKHITKFSVYYTHIEQEWKHFKKLL